MDVISLRVTTGDSTVDDIDRGVVGAFEAAFPGRIRGYYLLGNCSEGDALPGATSTSWCCSEDGSSPRGSVAQGRSGRLALSLARIGWTRLHRGEHELLREGHAAIKLASVCVYGEGIRDEVPLPPFDAYLRHCVTASCEYLGPILRGSTVLVVPLDYPEPAREFFGYDRSEQPRGEGYFGGGVGGMKAFVSGLGRAAQSIVAILCHEYVGNKGECLRRYRECVGTPPGSGGQFGALLS